MCSKLITNCMTVCTAKIQWQNSAKMVGISSEAYERALMLFF